MVKNMTEKIECEFKPKIYFPKITLFSIRFFNIILKKNDFKSIFPLIRNENKNKRRKL